MSEIFARAEYARIVQMRRSKALCARMRLRLFSSRECRDADRAIRDRRRIRYIAKYDVSRAIDAVESSLFGAKRVQIRRFISVDVSLHEPGST